MELLKCESAWFRSDAGRNYFTQTESLEHRVLFVYSYLKGIAKPAFDKSGELFKTAFFLADAVYESALAYGKFPDFLDPDKNPYIMYLRYAERCPDPKMLWAVYMSILHGQVDPTEKKEWIYKEYNPDELGQALEKVGCGFYSKGAQMADPECFKIDEELQIVQLKLIWFFAEG